jgi:putative SOS response-associated peptidase YedK
MCGRYNLLKDPERWLGDLVVNRVIGPFTAQYNIPPRTMQTVVRQSEVGPMMVSMHWGYLPHWATPEKKVKPQINARSETAAEKPMFRASMRNKRCLVPATGFYEWERAGGEKIPHHIHLKGGKPFLMAGIWDDPPEGDERGEPTFAILTTAANEAVQPLHDRMPVIIPLKELATWLDAPEDRLLTPTPAELFTIERVSKRINSPRGEGPYVLQPPSLDEQ